MAFRAIYCVLYSLLFVFLTILLGLTGYRIHYTETLSNGDILTTSSHFYDPRIVALLVATALTMIFTFVVLAMLGTIKSSTTAQAGHHFGVWILWIFFLITAALVTEHWSNLKWCRGSHKVCRILETIKAFSWICWGFLTFILIATMIHLVRGRDRGTTGGTRPAAAATPYAQTREAPTTAAAPGGGQSTAQHQGGAPKRETYGGQTQSAATAEPLYQPQYGPISTEQPTQPPRQIV